MCMNSCVWKICLCSPLLFGGSRIAVPAARGSWDDLTRLLQLLDTEGNMQIWTFCLPVFYANLDTAGIPRGDDITSHVVRHALLALSILRLMKPSHAAAGTDLWPRMWAWSDFLCTYRDCVGSIHPIEDVSADFLFFVACLRTDQNTATIMSQTPGVRRVLMHSWASLFERTAAESREGFVHLSTLLRDFMEADEPENREEILDATDGPGGLAVLIVKYIKHFMPPRRTAMTEEILFVFYDGIVTFTAELLDGAAGTMRLDIAAALLSAGIVEPLTTVIGAMSESNAHHEGVDGLLLECFESPARTKPSAESISAELLRGIMHSIVVCGGAEDLESSALWELMTVVLPAATVYHTVLVQLQPWLLEPDQFATSPAFEQTAMYHHWLYFGGLAMERIDVMNDRTEDYHPSRKACDNMECGLIREKTEFKQCSHCHGVYYCSTDCQKRDWRSGHRDTCNSLRISRFGNSNISGRNLSFLRKLCHSDSYLLEIPEELCVRLSLMRDHPAEPIVSILDYRSVDYESETCESQTTTLALAREADAHGEICWAEHVARAARSGGRMELHLMRICDGGRMRQFMFPKRSRGSALPDGLVRILDRRLDPQKEVENLSNATKDLQRIHQ
ncbi:hypothetical protein DFH06DRAFT_1305292 [Mycena polygramma]|nr:hypothetical protein DFH06DRAFT_1305292 [Mycena polygramma]